MKHFFKKWKFLAILTGYLKTKHVLIQRLLIAGFTVLTVGVYLAMASGGIGHDVRDDAFMFTRYAKNFLAGGGFSWNLADGPSYGITSSAYLFVVTAVLWLTRSPDAVVLASISFVFGLLSALVLVILGFLVQTRKWTHKSWVPLLVIPYLLIVPPFRYHCLTGMETTFSLLANSVFACTIVLASRRRSTAALLSCVVLGFLSVATRPDNGIYALFLPPLFFLATDRSLWRYSVRYALLLAMLVGFGVIVNRLLFGDFIPLPFFAKSSGFYKGYMGAHHWNAMTYMLLFWMAILPCLIIVVCCAAKRTCRQLIAISIPIMATFGYYATVTQIVGDNARYYYPSIAFFFLAAFTSMPSGDENINRAQSSDAVTTWRLAIGLLVLIPVLSPALRKQASSFWSKHIIGTQTAVSSVIQYQTPKNVRLPSLNWRGSVDGILALLERVPREVVLTASEYGVIGSRFPDRTIVDLVGLHDRTIAHKGFSAAYVLSRQPDIIWFPHLDYTYAIAQIRDDPIFALEYEYYPSAYRYGIALRRRSRFYPVIRTEMDREFSRIYPGLNMSDYEAEPVAPLDNE